MITPETYIQVYPYLLNFTLTSKLCQCYPEIARTPLPDRNQACPSAECLVAAPCAAIKHQFTILQLCSKSKIVFAVYFFEEVVNGIHLHYPTCLQIHYHCCQNQAAPINSFCYSYQKLCHSVLCGVILFYMTFFHHHSTIIPLVCPPWAVS